MFVCIYIIFSPPLLSSTLNCSFYPQWSLFAIHLNMTSEWNEFPLKVAVNVSLNWTLLLEVL